MCGIFCYFNSQEKTSCESLKDNFNKIKHRGPDFSTLVDCNNVKLGFHRLAIVDPTPDGNQPFYYQSRYMSICNGEIFNHEQLEKKHEFEMKTQSDCEILLPLFHKVGIKKLVDELDAEFAFVIYDKEKNMLYIARDPYGVRPLFVGRSINSIAFCSEAKGLTEFEDLTVEPFMPGHYMVVNLNTLETEYASYFNIHNIKRIETTSKINDQIEKYLTKSVNKRLMADKEIGCLLSGGLDSSLVTSIVSSSINNVHCFSIGL